MSDVSIFTDKSLKPADKDLADKLAGSYTLWQQVVQMVFTQYPDAFSEWNYPGKKFGWSFRIRDKKRVIIYLLTRDGYFKTAFVFGDKAVNEIVASNISTEIKTELQQAKKYAEGCGIRIDVTSKSILPHLEQLVRIKLKY